MKWHANANGNGQHTVAPGKDHRTLKTALLSVDIIANTFLTAFTIALNSEDRSLLSAKYLTTSLILWAWLVACTFLDKYSNERRIRLFFYCGSVNKLIFVVSYLASQFVPKVQ